MLPFRSLQEFRVLSLFSASIFDLGKMIFNEEAYRNSDYVCPMVKSKV